MTIDRGLLDRIRNRGEEVLTQLSADLMSNPRFVKALEGAMRGRDRLEQAAATALKQMNVPTRSELNRANSRIEALETELAELRTRARAARRRTATAGARRPAKAAAAPRRPAGRKAGARATRARSGSGGTE